MTENEEQVSQTPVLDLEKEPPSPPATLRLRLTGIVVGLAIAALLITADEGGLPDWHWPAFNGLLFFPVLYVVIAVHELGHLVASRLVGLRSGGIAVGGFFLLKSGRNWTFRFDRRACVGGFFKPLTGDGTFRASQFAWMVAGGPLASLFFAGFCLWIYLRFGNGFWNCVGSFFWLSLLIGLMAIIPFSSGLNKSDGASLLQIVRYPERAACRISLVSLQSEEARGLLPREWSAQHLGQILAVENAAIEYPYCQLLAFYRRMNERLEEDALQHLESALAVSGKAGPQFRHAVFLEAAFSCASIRHDAQKARIWRERACRVRRPISLNAVDAAIAMCEGRWSEASRLWESAKREVDRRKLDSGLIRFAREKWAEHQTHCKAGAETDLPSKI